MKRQHICILILLFAGLNGLLTAQPQYYNYNTIPNPFGSSAPFNFPDGRDVQLLYLSGEFNQPNPAPAGYIESISFFIHPNWPLGPQTYTDLTIKIGQSSITSFDLTGFYTGPLTTVYYKSSVVLTGPGGQWMTIILDTKFPYDPTQSLIVDVGQCAAPGVTGNSICFQYLTGWRRINGGGCPFVYYGADQMSPDMGITLCQVPTISGQNNVCVNSGYSTYSTEPGMTNYTWAVSAGGTIISGAGTNQVWVSWFSPGAQTISVIYANTCGNSPTVLNVTVNDLPAAAGPITGSAQVCAGQTGVPYWVAPVSGANIYLWTLPPDATIASGAGTPNITVDYGSNALSGNMSVNANNICGNGLPSPDYWVSVAMAGITKTGTDPAFSIYPNPANDFVNFSTGLPQKKKVTISIYNPIGQRIAVVYDGELPAGTSVDKFYTSGFTPGVYFYEILAGNEKVFGRLIIIR